MQYLIEYDLAYFPDGNRREYDIIGGWNEKEALLNFYEQHRDSTRRLKDCPGHERELLSKMMEPLDIDERICFMNNMLFSTLKITGVYKNLELVYVKENQE